MYTSTKFIIVIFTDITYYYCNDMFKYSTCFQKSQILVASNFISRSNFRYTLISPIAGYPPNPFVIENETENLSKEVPVGRVDGVGMVVVNILLIVVVLMGAMEALSQLLHLVQMWKWVLL